ncbi:hypothetical protein LBMAG36_06820 [Chlorobiota bacterium]|nr:hypothetical protein LBMAG36_06820 [Chlorobiota bacterium]
MPKAIKSTQDAPALPTCLVTESAHTIENVSCALVWQKEKRIKAMIRLNFDFIIFYLFVNINVIKTNHEH